MNGIENITKRINDDANEHVRRIISAAEEEAKKVSEEYKKKAEEMTAEREALAREAADALRERLVGAASLESKKMLLSKKQELISKAFDGATDKLMSLRGDELAEVLAILALRAAEGKSGEIILSPSVKLELGAKILEGVSQNPNLTISDETRDIEGGLILKSGSTEVNCTFTALVAEKREQMSRDIADILFS